MGREVRPCPPVRGPARPHWCLHRKEEPAAYAAAGIPVYLLIDRDACTVTVFCAPDPDTAGYRDRHTVAFGERLALPAPVGIALVTEILKTYVH